MSQQIIHSRSLNHELTIALSECSHDKLFVLVDLTTLRHCWPVISEYACLRDAHLIIIGTGDSHKELDTLSQVWTSLVEGGATRHSCLINLGGGMVTDLGGMAASTFKRGINFINLPTTLLAMVDASVGGKTGINFHGLKNEIGVFSEATHVILDTIFLKTLDTENLRSGYAEMLKHALLHNINMWKSHLAYDLSVPDLSLLGDMVSESVAVKQHIVTEDPHERGIRKALNFGHTVGHALESWALERGKPILHGYAVAYGMVCELYLSCLHTGFPSEKMRATVRYIRDYYGHLPITCKDYPKLLDLMRHDKKNVSDIINFTLLGDIGDIRINQMVSENDIQEALDFFREGG